MAIGLCDTDTGTEFVGIRMGVHTKQDEEIYRYAYECREGQKDK